ncbi:hypothetical protein ACP0AK_08860 [Listeria ivanovii]|uniref:Uncharacterized protein n=2 Tax=Listeria ivanovii TaxID=1638 RepID=G2ZDZ8_LISIP|nr:hypothetical protein [Listeria ivanovii]AHI56684.1 hypothetical protein AX25_11530 [Listeria ivanovii WSLC3009]AIS60569.1 hypothetical protein JL58_11515 [Listeria ivanovii subsp. londoniensis]AIS63398.1 hypothetical protein JL53_12015 [Listeria ivanovii subsp. londoniensis]AIS66101.1 hypothetical protein JL52_11340 [Listeria ivanovii subsp. ivanovii]MBC1760817.1 hypothetical protein [Listeria ivanovii]
MVKYLMIILIALAINGISFLFDNDIANLIAVIITALLLVYLMLDLTKMYRRK